MDSPPKSRSALAIGGPLGLAAGFALGAYARSASWGAGLEAVLSPTGQLWLNALKLAVVPLTVCLLVLGVCSLPRGREVGRWGAAAFACFALMMAFAATYSFVTTSVVLRIARPGELVIPEGLVDGSAAEEAVSGGSWVDALLPPNPFAAASGGNILGLAVLSILFGLALRQVKEKRRAALLAIFEAVRDAVLVFIGWVLAVLPLGVFAITFSFAFSSGLEVIRPLAYFTVLVSALLTGALLLFALAAMFASRAGVAQFCKAWLPSVWVAVGARSTLACLPSMVEGARRLDLPDPARELVLPSSVSLFRVHRMASSTCKLLFMAAVFGVPLTPSVIGAFLVAVLLLSFASPGIPNAGTGATFAAYMAAGIPAAGIVLFESVASLVDIFKTALNVTANFASAVLISWWLGLSRAPARSPKGRWSGL